ncbi:VOC family protein [Clostridium sp. CF012]|uniref:VOC family protein n=1 Tax=Clostridium sp. CF012 TaxID=2843319 RepID=UPI001C0E66EE|nr:VOC family protein [Clostridium sp. CF012]MBU3145203.1 VOC family protein [Clostridium sp. CF012]
MKVAFTTIEVKDLEESVDFYTKILCFKEVKRFSPNPEMKFVFVQGEGGGIIQLAENANALKETPTGAHALKAVCIAVDNLKNLVSILKENNVEFISELIETPEGIKMLFIKDPNGVAIELIEGFEI